MSKDKFRFGEIGEPFAQGFSQCGSENLDLKIACGLYEEAKTAPIEWDPEVGLLCCKRRELLVRHSFGNGIRLDIEKLEKARQDPAHAEIAEALSAYFQPIDTLSRIVAQRTPKQHKLVQNHTLWGGVWGGHTNPDYGMLLQGGTLGLRKKVEKYRLINPGKDDFYDSQLKVLDTMDLIGQRLHDFAVERAAEAAGTEQEKLLSLARALELVPQTPPNDFIAACQFFYMIFVYDNCDSPGRFDQYMIDYYRMTPEEEATKCLKGLWNGFHKTRAWNLCIGGSNQRWEDESNELSYQILNQVIETGYNTPNLTMRCHRNTPDALLKKAAQVLAAGSGLPALYNDEAVCPALEQLGIPPIDAHNYVMNGCNQIDIQGKSHMGLEDGEVNLLKCLEYALTNGVCLILDEGLGVKTGDASAFETYDDLLCAYQTQVAAATEIAVALANTSQKCFAQYAPNPWSSLLIQGCVEKGIDFKCGGPIYNYGQILTEGLADTADALAAIKHFVFEEKRVTMAELVDALKNDFHGYEDLEVLLSKYDENFGNDIPWVDDIAAGIIDHFFGEVLPGYTTYRDPQKGVYGGGLSTFNRCAENGRWVGATASGKRKGAPLLADSIGARPGADRNGPTALLNSCLKFNHKLAKSGFVLQMKFDKAVFETEKGMASFLALVKVYFHSGGQQLSVNVLNAQDLLDAQKDPKKFAGLVVRVGGYSDYFVNLPPELQQNIISRTYL